MYFISDEGSRSKIIKIDEVKSHRSCFWSCLWEFWNLKFNRVTRWFVIFNKEFVIFIFQEYRGYDCYLLLLLGVNLQIIKSSESTSYWLEIVRLIFIVRVSEFLIG